MTWGVAEGATWGVAVGAIWIVAEGATWGAVVGATWIVAEGATWGAVVGAIWRSDIRFTINAPHEITSTSARATITALDLVFIAFAFNCDAVYAIAFHFVASEILDFEYRLLIAVYPNYAVSSCFTWFRILSKFGSPIPLEPARMSNSTFL